MICEMPALQSQSSLLRFGFGQTKDTVPGLVDSNLPETGPKPKDSHLSVAEAKAEICGMPSRPTCIKVH